MSEVQGWLMIQLPKDFPEKTVNCPACGERLCFAIPPDGGKDYYFVCMADECKMRPYYGPIFKDAQK